MRLLKAALRPLSLLLWLLAPLFAPAPLMAQADSAVETGAFRLHKFKQAIGEEHYRIVRDTSGLSLTTAFEFTDRGRRVALDASLETAPDLTPLGLRLPLWSALPSALGMVSSCPPPPGSAGASLRIRPL